MGGEKEDEEGEEDKGKEGAVEGTPVASRTSKVKFDG